MLFRQVLCLEIEIDPAEENNALFRLFLSLDIRTMMILHHQCYLYALRICSDSVNI